MSLMAAMAEELTLRSSHVRQPWSVTSGWACPIPSDRLFNLTSRCLKLHGADGRIQPVVATPLIMGVLHGTTYRVDAEVNGARTDALARCAVASVRDRA